jgi:hypothetical protein
MLLMFLFPLAQADEGGRQPLLSMVKEAKLAFGMT